MPDEEMVPAVVEEDPMQPMVAKVQALFDAKLGAAQAWADKNSSHLPPIVITLEDVKALHE